MFYNLIPCQRKLSVLFSQGMGRHLAPGRTACAQNQQRQPPFSASLQEKPGLRVAPHHPPVLTATSPQESALRWECPSLSQVLGSAAQGAYLLRPARTLTMGFLTSLGGLNMPRLNCGLWRRVVSHLFSTAPVSNQGLPNLCPNPCQSSLFHCMSSGVSPSRWL